VKERVDAKKELESQVISFRLLNKMNGLIFSCRYEYSLKTQIKIVKPIATKLSEQSSGPGGVGNVPPTRYGHDKNSL
jgi:hypothetical protein